MFRCLRERGAIANTPTALECAQTIVIAQLIKMKLCPLFSCEFYIFEEAMKLLTNGFGETQS